MRIVATSDLHGHLPTELPEGDVLVIAGDIMPVEDHSYIGQIAFLDKFEDWLRQQKYDRIFGIAGNHDFLFDVTFSGKEVLNSYKFRHCGTQWAALPWTYMCRHNYQQRIGDYYLYGSPMSPTFGPWAFMGRDDELAREWRCFSGGDDAIWLIHGPPYGAGDRTLEGEEVGSKTLRAVILKEQPKVVICGHIHEGYGSYKIGDTDIYNVSYMDRSYSPSNQPIVIDI